MPWIPRNGKRLWVGFHLGLGPVIIAEREVHQKEEHITAFVVKEHKASTFKTAVLRSRMRPEPMTAEEASQAMSIFDGNVKTNHQNYLTRVGQAPSQLRNSRISRMRSTKCYRCGAAIDSEFYLECAACGWIVCDCGACGCGYDKRVI